MNIIITTNTLQAGGAEKQRVMLANELASRGHLITLWCLQKLGPLRAQINPLVNIIGPSLVPPLSPRYDHVISGTTNTESVAALVLKLLNCRHITWTIAIHNPMGPGAPRLKRLSGIALQLSDSVIALTPHHAAAIERDWRIVVDGFVPNEIDSSWAEGARSERATTTSRPFDVGYLGRISIDHKGLDLLVKAMAGTEASSLTLAIGGEGLDEAKLRSLIEQERLQSRVTWLGHQEPADFLPRIGALALFSRYEGQPLTLLEAEAANVPVVASIWSGVDPNTPGVLVIDPRDAEVAAAALASQSKSTRSIDISRPSGVAAMADNYLNFLARSKTGKSTRLRRGISRRRLVDGSR